jgi:type VI secretion system secreted protein VgrG
MAVPDLRPLFDAQHRRLIRLHGAGDDQAQLLPESFHATETLSAPYRIDLTLLCENAALALKQFIGQRWELEIELYGAKARYFSGYISEFSHIGSDGACAQGLGAGRQEPAIPQ